MNDPTTSHIAGVIDVSEATEATLKSVPALISAGRRDEAINQLLAAEKKARLSSDAISATRVVKFLLTLHKEAGDWDGFMEQFAFVAKRRAQLKRPIIDAAQMVLGWVNPRSEQYLKLPDATEDKLMETIATVTEGKIFVEIERAKTIKLQADKLERQGKITEAAALLTDVQPESFGDMDLRERMEYIINQMRLTILTGDFVRCQIMSKKIYQRNIDLPEMTDLKLQYNQLLTQYFLEVQEYNNLAASEFRIFTIHHNAKDRDNWMESLQRFVVFSLFAPFDNEQSDSLNRLLLLQKKALSELPVLRELVEDYLSPDFVTWPPKCLPELKAMPVFQRKEPNAEAVLRKRFFHHNINVVANCYTTIRLTRLAELLGTTLEEAETELGEMLREGKFYARIDRPADLVQIGNKNTPERLEANRRNFTSALKLVDETTQLIKKELMVSSAKAAVVPL